MVFNLTKESCATTFLIDMELIKEFYRKETDVSIKEPPVDFQQSFGFVFQGQTTGLEHRAIFAEFFRMDKLNLIIPKVY